MAITFREMGEAVVLLFLLDTLPDYNSVISNTTLSIVPGINTISCFPTINAEILDVLNQKLGFAPDSVLRKEPSDLDGQSDSLQDLSTETIYNTIYDNSIQGSIVDFFDEADAVEDEDVSECEKPSKDFAQFNKMSNPGRDSYAVSAPFSAAIFETVANVTAQTCGGALVSAYWVLTAASCVNVLRRFYSNPSHAVNNSYAIILGASNPLKDGTVHNVTEIILHPSTKTVDSYSKSSLHSKQWWNSKKRPIEKPKSTIALMRIDPGLKEGILRIGDVGIDWNVTVDMYGWALIENETGHSAMLSTLVPLNLLGAAKCESVYGTTELHGTLCLSVNDTWANVTRMTSGGPVVATRDGQRRLLGVALADSSPLLASYLLAHRDWIRRVTGTLDHD